MTLGGYATYQYSAGVIDAEQYGDRMIGMGLSLLGGVGTLRAAGLGSMTVGQATQVAVRTAQTTARAAGRALSQIELNPAALTQFNSGIPLNLLRWKQTGNPLAKIAEGFGTAAERAAPVSAAKPQLNILNPSFTPNQASLNKVTAFDFYTGAGAMSADDALLHMRGIDFAHSVNVVDVPFGTTAQQLGRPGGMGSYFSSMGETALRTGVEPAGRVPMLFQSMSPTKALQSTASNFVWPVGPTPGAGGAIQYYIPNKNVFTPLTRTYAKP